MEGGVPNRDAAFFVSMGPPLSRRQARHGVPLSAQVDDGGERICQFVTRDLYPLIIGYIDSQLDEQQPVELGLVTRTSPFVQLVGLVQVVQHSPGVAVALLQLFDGLAERGLQARPFVTHGPELLSQLGLGPIWVQGQLDVAILLVIQLGQASSDTGFVSGILSTALLYCLVEQPDEPLPELGWQGDGVVVAGDGLLQLRGPNVRQLADASLPTSADEVEVQLTGLALAAHHDQAATAAIAPHDAFEVVVVAPLPIAGSRHRQQHLLHPIEQPLRHQFRVPALVLGAAEVDVAQVVAVAEQLFHDVD